jgi:hypothetical protein
MRCRRRAGEAVAALYAEHALGLVRLAVIMTGDQASAEDIVQDAFLGLYRRWEQLTDTSFPLAYVRTSVLNGCPVSAAPPVPAALLVLARRAAVPRRRMGRLFLPGSQRQPAVLVADLGPG